MKTKMWRWQRRSYNKIMFVFQEEQAGVQPKIRYFHRAPHEKESRFFRGFNITNGHSSRATSLGGRQESQGSDESEPGNCYFTPKHERCKCNLNPPNKLTAKQLSFRWYSLMNYWNYGLKLCAAAAIIYNNMMVINGSFRILNILHLTLIYNAGYLWI